MSVLCRGLIVSAGHTVSHTFMLQQSSIVISHCVVGGREVIGVTTIFFVMRGLGGFIIRCTVTTMIISSSKETVKQSEVYTTVRLNDSLQYVTFGSTSGSVLVNLSREARQERER